MVTVVMLNPCVDRALVVDGLNVGALNIIRSKYETPSGKGLNLAAALRALRAECFLTGLMPGESAGIYGAELSRLGIPFDFVAVPGRVRVNTKIVDKAAGIVTELNERGEPAAEAAAEALCEKVRRLCAKSRYTVFTGSVPPGLPDAIYRRLIGIAKSAGSLCVLDADGEPFREGAGAAPFLVKPNIAELERYSGRSLRSLDEIKRAAEGLIEKGVKIALVSLGSGGALITDAKTAFYCAAAEVSVADTTGAGDAMLAGALYSLMLGGPLDEILKHACAAAALCVSRPGPVLSDADGFDHYLPLMKIRPA